MEFAEYRPETSFFYLGPDPEWTERTETADDSERYELEKQYEADLQVLEVFKKRGWRHIISVLETKVQESKNHILKTATDPQDIAKHRARIEAFELLLDYPVTTRAHADWVASHLSDQ